MHRRPGAIALLKMAPRLRAAAIRCTVREAATQILVERCREREGLSRTLALSVGVHSAVLAALVLWPGDWLSAQQDDTDRATMTIRLGGPEGPSASGLAPLGGRPIQAVLPLPEARRPQWIQPPTPTRPKMILPTEDARRRREPETDVDTVPEEARGRTPTRGPETHDGSTMADTGVEGAGIGLSTGGLGGSGGALNLADFCCPEYLATMVELIRRRWDSNQQVPGAVVVRFTVRRSGAIEEVGVDHSSNYVALDLSAQRAVLLTRQLPRLPSAFMEDNLKVRLTFEYRHRP